MQYQSVFICRKIPPSLIHMSVYELANEWLRIDKDDSTRKEIQDLLDSKNEVELGQRLHGRISFGTAGLRAQMGAGFTRMNSVTVIQASQGLAEYLLGQVPDARSKGVVIGRDARHNSHKFATLAAAAFVGIGIKVHWFEEIVATPLVPFAVGDLGAAGGVMVTASHNPAQDNGYKVYWSNGCQIIPPHDGGIAASILENLEPSMWSLDRSNKLFSTVDDGLKSRYHGRISSLARLEGPLPRFVYTPMHGVGLPFFSQAVARLVSGSLGTAEEDFGKVLSERFCVVSAQALPDPDFKTVKFPNPEEHGALDLSMAVALQRGCKLIFANDPDADRLAVAEYVEAADESLQKESAGRWIQFTGNEVGVLLASYALETYRSRKRTGKLAMLCSTVSTGMLAAMAETEGFHFCETLTGFKWLGNVAQDLIREGFDATYAFEEALGYMFTDVAYDKDGITSGAMFLAAASSWQRQSMTPYQKLQQLYRTYGYFADANTYLISPSPKVTEEAFAAVRALRNDIPVDGEATSQVPHPTRLAEERILHWRDLTIGYDSLTDGHKPALPVDSTSQMITCQLEGDVRFTVRGSGTEPKIKLYVECKAGSHEEAKRRAVEAQQLIVREWFSPARYGLKLAT